MAALQGQLKWREDRDALVAEQDGERVGRMVGDRIEVGGHTFTLEERGRRSVLVEADGDVVLRFDSGGARGRTLWLGVGRFRAYRRRGPLRSVSITRDYGAETEVVRATTGPLGTVVEVKDAARLHPRDVAALAAGATLLIVGERRGVAVA
ncbi:MAG: hypothetical protein ACLGIR_03220 [Actinomycetes bacterium]